MTESPPDGLLVLDKPAGLTSHTAIRKVGRLLGGVKVGHTGTLDPFATGVLPVLLGRATRIAQFLVLDTKEYRATVRLGRATDTLDPTGETTETADVPALDREAVESVLERFTGESEQIPPMFSAKKVNGQPLYKAARKGREVERKPKSIVIHRLELLALEPTRLDLLVRCSAGTYIRVLADDVARALGTVGHLETLTRTASGDLRIDDALPLAEIEDAVEGRRIGSYIRSIDEVLSALPRYVVSEQDAPRVACGGAVAVPETDDTGQSPDLASTPVVRLADPTERLLAIAKPVFGENGATTLQPIRVFIDP